MEPHEIRQWRQAHGIGVRELARILDISPSTVIRWESGAIGNAGPMLRYALAGIAQERKQERAARNAEPASEQAATME